MNYYRRLAFELRVRGLDEDRIRSTLDDVRSDCSLADAGPEDRFGDPRVFAAQFPQHRTWTPGKRFVTVVVVVAALLAVSLIALSATLDIPMRVGPLSVPLWSALLLAVGGCVGGFVLDRRLPRGFDATEAGR
ncbi:MULTISPECIES: hypothetical protein [unclassified Clavibacter]|uniref:hypothetical protein n=1 Tax=unclassified Clavibacter TaxID=2626594 RepID=UPI0022EB29BE|nr:hypothetical protein [Clavibacter sp. CT19]MDA3804823.1 hypothetical protein [Clavibacter sp. CT19]